MKKALLSSMAVAIFGVMNAQITITSADIAPIYTVAVQANDTTPSITLGASGASQTWDYSMLNNQSQDTLTFTLPQFTPYGSSIPGTNLVAEISNNGAPIYNYMTSTSSELNTAGVAADPFGTGTMPIPFYDPELIINFPSTYNTSFIDTARAMVQMYYGQDPGIGFTVDSFRIHIFVKKTSNVDGWGTVTTPAMNNIASIRQNVLRVEYDTVDIYAFGNWAPDFFDQADSNRVYTHWANGAGVSVCELTDYQDQGTITSATYLVSTSLSGINEQQHATEVKAYPVPANDVLNLSFKADVAVVNVYDVNGRMIQSNRAYTNFAQINTSVLPNGIYLYDLLDANGNSVSKNKFSVAH